MFEKFYPDEYADSAYIIDFKKYYDRGYRAVILDVDNTLVEHGAPYNDSAVSFFENLRNLGFKFCIISNNHEERIKPFADGVGSPFIYDAGKPLKKGYIEAMSRLGSSASDTMFVGDQIFTDILGANNAGIYCILVKYIKFDHEIQIVLKRILEKVILFFYKRRER